MNEETIQLKFEVLERQIREAKAVLNEVASGQRGLSECIVRIQSKLESMPSPGQSDWCHQHMRQMEQFAEALGAQGERLAKLERWQSYVLGGVAIAGLAIGFFGESIREAFRAKPPPTTQQQPKP